MVNLCRDEVTHTLKHKVSGSVHSPAHPTRRLLLSGRLLQLLAAPERQHRRYAPAFNWLVSYQVSAPVIALLRPGPFLKLYNLPTLPSCRPH